MPGAYDTDQSLCYFLWTDRSTFFVVGLRTVPAYPALCTNGVLALVCGHDELMMNCPEPFRGLHLLRRDCTVHDEYGYGIRTVRIQGMAQGSGPPPLLAHDVGFLTLGPKLGPPFSNDVY